MEGKYDILVNDYNKSGGPIRLIVNANQLLVLEALEHEDMITLEELPESIDLA